MADKELQMPERTPPAAAQSASPAAKAAKGALFVFRAILSLAAFAIGLIGLADAFLLFWIPLNDTLFWGLLGVNLAILLGVAGACWIVHRFSRARPAPQA